MLWLAFIAELGLAIARQLQDERVAPSVRGRLEREVLAAWGDIIARADIAPEQLPFLDQVLEQAIIPPGYVVDSSTPNGRVLRMVFDPVIHVVDEAHPLEKQIAVLFEQGKSNDGVVRIFMHAHPKGFDRKKDLVILPAILAAAKMGEDARQFVEELLEMRAIRRSSRPDHPNEIENAVNDAFTDASFNNERFYDVMDVLGAHYLRALFQGAALDMDDAAYLGLKNRIFNSIYDANDIVDVADPYEEHAQCPECGGDLEATTGEGRYTVYQLCPVCDWSNWPGEAWQEGVHSWSLGGSYAVKPEVLRELEEHHIYLTSLEPFATRLGFNLSSYNYVRAAERALDNGFVLALMPYDHFEPQASRWMGNLGVNKFPLFQIIDPWPEKSFYPYQGAAPEQAAQTKKLLDSLFRSRR